MISRLKILKIPILCLLALSAAAAPPAEEQPLPPANTPEVKAILERYVSVTGGRKAYDAVRTRVVKGKITLVEKGTVVTFTSYHAKPRESYMVMESAPMGRSEKGTTGGLAWEVGPAGAKILAGKEREEALREAVLDKLVYWNKIYEKAYLMGNGTIGSKECYMVLLAPKEGMAEAVFFEKESGLAVMLQMGVGVQEGAVPVVSRLSNYKKAGGLLLPFTAEFSVMGEKRLLEIESIEQNVKMPPDRFSPPESVKALQPKKQPTPKKSVPKK